MEGDDRTFRLNFTSEGVVKLREQVTEKLKEFMGDYTDDTLVEYVIVLLKNGRHKDEAKNELNVFLGDDSDSFESWLWDHLVSNLDFTETRTVPCLRRPRRYGPCLCFRMRWRHGRLAHFIESCRDNTDKKATNDYPQ